MNCVVGPKNVLLCVFLCFWLGREQCRGTQPKTQTLETLISKLKLNDIGYAKFLITLLYVYNFENHCLTLHIQYQFTIIVHEILLNKRINWFNHISYIN